MRASPTTPHGIGYTLVLTALIFLAAPPAPAWAEEIRDQQWYLDTLRAEEVHGITQGEGVVVAVVDGGVGEVEELTGQVVGGYSYIRERSDYDWDGAGHGTAMAGIIAATGTDDAHYQGLAPGVDLLSVRVSATTDLKGRQSFVAEGIRWAVDNGAKVINLSLAMEPWTEENQASVAYALSKGAIVVAGTGNAEDESELEEVLTPADLPGVIAVTGLDREGNLAATAVRGEGTTLAAPGSDIPLLIPDNLNTGNGTSYSEPTEGTSISTAIVSAAAALVWAEYPELSANDVIQRLIATADDLGEPGYDTDFGYGQVNILEALTADVPTVVANPLTSEGAAANASATSAAAGDSGDGGRDTMILAIVVAVALAILVLIVALTLRLLRRGPARP